MKNRYIKIIIPVLLVWLSNIASAQEMVKGRVVAADSRNGIVANIATMGSGQRSSADSNGEFILKLAKGVHQLRISLIGYKTLDTMINVPSSTLLLTLMPATTQLNEVVVNTGYQSLPMERATGSFTVIDNKVLNEQVGTDIIGRLEGVASSLSVDRSTNGGGLMIRGLSTIRGVREPLIILDNFPYEGKLENINPNDIENVTILKDAAAASIWGARAGNGVIVLTSKKARVGQQLRISLDANVKITAQPDLYYLSQITPSDYVEVEKMLFGKGFFTSQENATSRPALTPAVELMIAARDGKINTNQLNEQLNVLKTQDLREDLNRYMYGNGVFQQYNVDLKGGDIKNAWNIGAGYDRNMNELSAGFKRLNLKADHLINLTDRLTLNTRLTYTQTNTTSGKTGINDLSAVSGKLPPYIQLADEAGNALPVMKTYRASYTEGIGNGQLLDWNYYPLTDYQYNNTASRLNELLFNGMANYRILPGLSAELRYQYQRQQNATELLNGVEGYYARNLINTYSQLVNGAINRIVPMGGILSNTQDLLTANNLRGQLKYNFTKGKHQLAVLLGTEMRSTRTNGNSFTTYGYNDDRLTFLNVDYTTTYPSIINGSKTFINNMLSFNAGLNNYVSTFANVAYTYQNKYTISLSGRKDASNLFGLNANDKWNPFYSVGLAWLLSSENFMQTNLLPYLKLRATYGVSGNTDPRMAAVTTLSYGASSPYTQSLTAGFSNYANSDLRWERVANLNLGLDYSLAVAGIRGSVEYYQKRARDLFGLEPLDYTSGVGLTVLKNTASMKAQGLDIELSAAVKMGAFTWTPSVFFNYYKDEITDYYVASQQGSNYVRGNLSISGIVGKPVYAMLSYKFAGLDPVNGDPRGMFGGQISKTYSSLTGAATTLADLVYHGPLYAPYAGAIGNTLQYKSLQLAFRVSFKAGNYFRKETINYATLYTNRTGHGDFAKRWQQAGDEALTTVPSMVYPAVASRDNFYAYSEATILRGDLIRLQYINLNYTFTQQKYRALPFSSLQLFAVANNLGLLYSANEEGIDPDFTGIPPTSSYAFGIRTQF
ncbi:MAG: SusC/RagA family TonB-linked outer membrane protein [Flavobacteriales bacterium]|nr:MAG: SusC/RagA family TonB-linked outer membrane protein [Flavobacteriales bacterium]